MRRWLAALLLVLWAALGWAAEGEPVAVPGLSGRVTDLTGTLKPDEAAALEQRLAEFEAAKGAQVVVLLLPTTGPETIDQFGIRVMDAWKIGRKGVDDGVILIVAKNDRRVRIEVGYGLEGALNDATAKRIIAEGITPRFKAGDFYGGISAGVAAIIGVVEAEALPAASGQASGGADSGGGSGGILDFDSIGENTFLIGLAVLAIGGAALRFFLGNLLGSALVGSATGLLGWLFTGTMVGLGIGFAVGVFLALFGLDLLLSGIGGSGSGGSGGGGFSGGGGGGGGGGASGSW